MRLTLLRHGTADSASWDHGRRLTAEGRAEVAWVADTLITSGWRPGIILVSPLIRAQQTAEIVAERLDQRRKEGEPEPPLVTTEVLASGSVDSLLWLAADQPDPLLVGHEPTLGMFAARLMGAPMNALPVDRAGVVIFEVDRLPSTRPARLLLWTSPRWRP